MPLPADMARPTPSPYGPVSAPLPPTPPAAVLPPSDARQSVGATTDSAQPGDYGGTAFALAYAGQQQANTDVVKLGKQTQSNYWGPYQQIIALGLLFGVLYVISRTRAGYVAIYYGQALILLFLFATQWRFFAQALSPLKHLTFQDGPTQHGEVPPASGLQPLYAPVIPTPTPNAVL